jgi:hypothetical protein
LEGNLPLLHGLTFHLADKVVERPGVIRNFVFSISSCFYEFGVPRNKGRQRKSVEK